LNTATSQRAESIVVDSKVQIEEESGDSKAAISEGKYDCTKVVDLKEALVGMAQGRTNAKQMVPFKSVGTAVQHVMSGFAVYQGRPAKVGE
jgi:alanine dehydrogenase